MRRRRDALKPNKKAPLLKGAVTQVTGGFFFFYFLYRTLPPLRGPPSLDRDGFNWKNFNHSKSRLRRGKVARSEQQRTSDGRSRKNKNIRKKRKNKNNKKKTTISSRLIGSGSVLTSRAVASQVLSALKSLTSVFGMRTGGSSSPLPPLLYYSD